MHIIKIKEEHYRAPLSWVIGTEEELQKLLDKLDIDLKLDMGCEGHCVHAGEYSAIWVNPGLEPDKYLRVLNHELLHYVIGTLDKRGIPINLENEEDIAYFQEKMLKRCMAIDLKKYIK